MARLPSGQPPTNSEANTNLPRRFGRLSIAMPSSNNDAQAFSEALSPFTFGAPAFNEAPSPFTFGAARSVNAALTFGEGFAYRSMGRCETPEHISDSGFDPADYVRDARAMGEAARRKSWDDGYGSYRTNVPTSYHDAPANTHAATPVAYPVADSLRHSASPNDILAHMHKVFNDREEAYINDVAEIDQKLAEKDLELARMKRELDKERQRRMAAERTIEQGHTNSKPVTMKDSFTGDGDVVMDESEGGKPVCKYGSDCHRRRCRFSHPGRDDRDG